ncbi:MAG TPA: hypothetical protein VIT20_03755 [Propionibacteriaceae bacterium]
MFDYSPAGLDGAAAAAAIDDVHTGVLEGECRLFQLAAHWADLHAPDGLEATRRVLPGAERGLVLGGEGTPEVLEFAADELGPRLEMSGLAAHALMADALDVRHRLPLLWAMVCAGGVRVWRVRKIAVATRHLDLVAAAAVDRAVAGSVALLPWGRFENLLEAKVIEADPVLAEHRARLWESERFVRAGRSRNGLKTLVARAHAGEVIVFTATVNRIAEILAERGDLDTADVRRSKAIGILGQPALALELLWAHAQDAPEADLPVEPDPAQPLFDDETGSAPDPEPGAGGLVVRRPPVRPVGSNPRVVLYVHLSEEALRSGPSGHGAVRLEGAGPLTVGQLRRFLGGFDGEVRVQPVVDLNDTPPAVDAYEIPDRMREQLTLTQPATGFPFGPSVSRRMDVDHTIPYRSPDRGGPPGQTRVGGLNRMVRREHRVKTHGGWPVRQPDADSTVWRSPHGAYFLVTRAGTQKLGTGAFAQAVWRAAGVLDDVWVRPRPETGPRLSAAAEA